MERPRYLDKNCGDEGLITKRGRRICEHKRLFWGIWLQKRHSAAEFVLLLPSWNIAEIQVRFTPCPLHFRVQSCSDFWPDGRASPLCLTVRLLSVHCSNCWTRWPILIPPNTASATSHYLTSVLCNFFSAFLVCHFFLVSCCFSLLFDVWTIKLTFKM